MNSKCNWYAGNVPTLKLFKNVQRLWTLNESSSTLWIGKFGFEFNYRLQRHYCQPLLQVYQSDAVDTRNHIDFNFPYSLKGLIFSFWLQEYDTNLWEREKKDTVAEITCSHFCSNNYCLIDVDVLTKPTVLWIFIDLFNFRSLFHIIWRWYLEVYVDVRYALSLYTDNFNKLEIILFCLRDSICNWREMWIDGEGCSLSALFYRECVSCKPHSSSP